MPRVVRFHELGEPEVLRIETLEIPPPGPGEVQIRVRALGLNRAEALIRSGRYVASPPLPSGLGCEAAGEIESLGPGVTALAPGDAVSVMPPPSMVRWPAYGEIANFPAELVVRHPAALSWEAAAATWMQYLTAYGALIDIARLGRGEFVAITAASSSVGLAAIQIANAVGAIPVAITRKRTKMRDLLAAGAAHVIVSEEEDLLAGLTDIAGPEGIRVVFDAVGGPAFGPLTAAMARGGILLEYGGLSPEPTPFPLLTVLSKSLILRGYVVHEIIGDPQRRAAAKTFTLQGLENGTLKPVIDRVFPFEQIVEAHRYLESNVQFGKIVVTL